MIIYHGVYVFSGLDCVDILDATRVTRKPLRTEGQDFINYDRQQ